MSVTYFFLALKKYHLAILSGFLIAFSYPPLGSWALTFCFAPLWVLASRLSTWKEVFWAGWWTQFILSLIGFHWIAHTAHAFGNLPWSVSVLALLLFATFVHLHIPLALVLTHNLSKKVKWPLPVTFLFFALLTGLLERSWPMIFPWHIGYSLLFSRLEAFQLAEWIGFNGLSQLLLLINAIFATSAVCFSASKFKSVGLMIAGLFLFFSLSLIGAISKPEASAANKMNVLIVQANIGQLDKVLAEKNLKANQGEIQQAVMDRYFSLTTKALLQYPETQVIVWPETALADYLDIDYLSRSRQLQLRSQIQTWDKALITGGYSREFGTEKVYNGLFFFNAQGQLTDTAYRKSQLLAFGERLPFGDLFPWLYKILPFVSSFDAGPGPEIKKITIGDKIYSVAPQICYESLYPWFTRNGTQLGADFIVNVTNDSWFGQTFEPYQHATMTWARAIETRRPLIRSTNTGQSSIITETGTVLMKSPLGEEWFQMASVPIPIQRATFYMKYGHLDWILYIVILLGTSGGLYYHGRKKK
jgi:apolipoprotein N-acyltransferase